MEKEEYDIRYDVIEVLRKIGSVTALDKLQELQKIMDDNLVYAIASIQSRCQFYNYEIFQAAKANDTISAIDLPQEILTRIDQRTKQMLEESKVDRSINISNSKNVKHLNTGDSKTLSILPENKSGFDWKFWLPLAVTVIGIIVSVAASGVSNDEIKKWFIKPEPSLKVDQKLDNPTN